MRREASPADRAGEAELVKVFGVVVRDTTREDLALPGICRRFKALQLTQSFKQTALAEQLGAWRDVLPAKQPVHELRLSYRFDLFSELPEGEAMNAGQEAALAPFCFLAGRVGEFSAQDDAAGFEAKESTLHVRCRHANDGSELGCGDRSAVRHPACDYGELRVFPGRFGVGQLWQRDVEGRRREDLAEGMGALRRDPVGYAVALCASGAALRR